MRKFRTPLTTYENKKLEELSQLDFSRWNETEVREHYIIPLLNLLGYKKDCDYDVSSAQSYRLNPLFLQIGSTRVELDYIFSVRKSKFWLIEAKSGYKNIKGKKSVIGKKEIDQAYFYSLHPEINCPYFVVSNGWDINIYERDNLREDLEPVLSVSRDSLVDKFLEIDSFIGATQILPHLKNKLLNDVKNVLSAEVYLDRLDEFVKEVERVINEIRPHVLENFRDNAVKQKKRGEEDFKKLVNQEPLNMIPFTVFNNVSSGGQVEALSNIVLERFEKSAPIERKIFLSTALLEEPRPVTIDYYFNLITFLIKIYRLDPKCTDTVSGNTFEEILVEWIELILSGFDKKPILRYLWAFEGLLNRLNFRLLIISPDTRKKIDSVVESDIYFLPEEKIAWNSPNPASEVIMINQSSILTTLGGIINSFYDKNTFKEASCYQKYKEFKKLVEKIENETDKEYWQIKNELGNEWGILRPYEFTNHYLDQLSNGICNILKSEPDILELLSPEFKKRIEVISSIRIDHGKFKNQKIVFFCEDCAKILGLKTSDIKISINEVEKYFDPSEKNYKFRI